MSQELISLAEYTVQKAMTFGVEEAEAYLVGSRGTETFIENNDVKICKSDQSSGIGIRVHLRKSLGFASSNILSKEVIQQTIRSAVKIAKASPRDQHLGLPMPKPLPRVNGIYDSEAEELDPSETVKEAAKMLRSAKAYDRRVTVDSGAFGSSVTEKAIANSYGLACRERTSIFTWVIMGMALDDGDVSSFDSQFEGTHWKRKVDVVPTAEALAKNVIASLNPKKIESFRGPVFFSPEVVETLLAGPLSSAVSSANIQKGRSPFAKKLNQQIGAKELNMVDDATYVNGLSASSFDREGSPHNPLPIVQNGILSSFLYNAYTGRIEDRESTGHAVGGTQAVPGVGTTNLLISGGKRRADDILGGLKKGITVTRFSGNINFASGDFSGVVKGGSYVEKGKIMHSLKGTLIAGNIYDLLQKISSVSRERRQIGSSLLPSIMVEDVSITSS